MKPGGYFIPHTQIYSEWVKSSTVRPEAMDLLEETDRELPDIGLGGGFSNLAPKQRQQRGK